MQTTNIYTLSHPVTGEVRYVGKANNIKERFNCHIKNSRLNSEICHRTSWIKSLKLNGMLPVIDVIDVVDYSEWKFWEKHYISLFKSWGFNLVNSTNGGDGVDGIKVSDVTKEKIRAANIGKKQSLETIRKRTRSKERHHNWGKKYSKELRNKLSQSHKGKKHSTQTIEKIREKMNTNHPFKGKKLSDNHIEKIKQSWVRRRIEGKVFGGTSEAALKGWETRRKNIGKYE